MLRKLLNSEITKETGKAFLIKVELLSGSYSELWFPKSAIDIEELDSGKDGDIYAQNWVVENKQEEIDDYIFTDEKEY